MVKAAVVATLLISFGGLHARASTTVDVAPPAVAVDPAERGLPVGAWWDEPPFAATRPGLAAVPDETIRLRLGALFHIAHVRAAAAVCPTVEEAGEGIDRMLERTTVGPLSADELTLVETLSVAFRERHKDWAAEEMCDWAAAHYGTDGALHDRLIRPRRAEPGDPEVTSALPRNR